MSGQVWAYHAGLDRYAEVAESALGQLAHSGWVQQDPPPEPDEDADEIAAAEAAQAEPDPSPASAEAPEE